MLDRDVKFDLRTVASLAWGVIAGTAGPVLASDGIVGTEWVGLGGLAAGAIALGVSWIDAGAKPVDATPADPRQQRAVAVESGAVLEEERFISTIKSLYPNETLFGFNGFLYPIVVVEDLSGNPDPDVDSILGVLTDGPLDFADSHYDPRFEEAHDRIVERCGGDSIGNLIGYAMDRIDFSDHGAQLHCKLGTFALAQATSFQLERELLDALSTSPSGLPGLGDLPARYRVHSEAKNPILSGSGRCAEIAVSVLTVIETPTPEILLFRRSGLVATDRFKLHVAPSGKFQRSGELAPPDNDPQYSLLLTVLREFAEEVLGVDEAQGDEAYPARTAWDLASVMELRQRRAEGGIETYRAGLAVSLTDLQPEVIVLMVVHDMDRWLRSRMSPNWEYLGLKGLSGADRQFRYQLDEDCALLPSDIEQLRPREMVSRAAVALSLGLEAYKTVRR